MKFFRLEDASRASPTQAFSGLGGLYAAGRWHTLGHRIIYTSQSLALASLEKLVHAHSLRALSGLNYFEVDIPDEMIERPQDLPARWNTDPVDPATQAYGDRWLQEQRSVALQVPSAIIGPEYNCLLNPAHPDFTLGWVSQPRPFDYDPRIKATYAAALTGNKKHFREINPSNE